MTVTMVRFRDTAGYPRRYTQVSPAPGECRMIGEGAVVRLDGKWRLVPWGNINEVVYDECPVGEEPASVEDHSHDDEVVVITPQEISNAIGVPLSAEDSSGKWVEVTPQVPQKRKPGRPRRA